MFPKNYDKSTGLYWFCKVDRHPDPALQSLALAFCEGLASSLRMQAPALYWFEEADFRQASLEWLDNPAVRKPEYADPLRESCKYFRWTDPPGTAFYGYTHGEAPLGIMVNVSCHGEVLLETVAEECFHVYQDCIHGSGWRVRAGTSEVEAEARQFLKARAAEIQGFLERFGRRASL